MAVCFLPSHSIFLGRTRELSAQSEVGGCSTSQPHNLQMVGLACKSSCQTEVQDPSHSHVTVEGMTNWIPM